MISDVILDSIIVLSLVTTFLGPLVSKRLLYPDSKRLGDYPTVDDYLISDIHPLHLEEDLGSIMMHVRGQEIPVFPVTDRNGIYAGVVELGILKELLLGEELKNLVIVQDLVNRNYPFVYRDEPLDRVFDRFRENVCPALPVLEASETGDYYLGLLLLKDLLPELTIEGGRAFRNRSG
ncbi:MAG TPA: CBS domain-containing protein [bacterium]|nr:CBS domain-containing protein [bacterium]HNS48422.1 CBS domain-containing protein [bacterium]